MSSDPIKILRGSTLSCNQRFKPGISCSEQQIEQGIDFIDDAALIVQGNLIKEVLAWESFIGAGGNQAIQQHPYFDYRGKLVVPGFIDCHVHGAQLDVIASYGTELLDWLNIHTFPAELAFANPEHSREIAKLFFRELIRNGTTSAAIWPTVHANSSEAFFAEAAQLKMRAVCGKVLMDQECPAGLRDSSPDLAKAEILRQIEKWHGQGRLNYALTPRFAIATSEPLMRMAGALFRQVPGLYMQNHLAENRSEVAKVAQLYPKFKTYLQVYEAMGFLGPRSIFAHCIWLDNSDWSRISTSNSSIAFCPGSNLFLGSGFFHLDKAYECGIPVGLATDVGGGTSLNMLKTMSNAYQVIQQQHQSLHPLQSFYLATAGAAEAMDWGDHVGRLAAGMEADLVVLNWSVGELSQRRTSAKEWVDRLFALQWLGDDRNVVSTWINGDEVTLS